MPPNPGDRQTAGSARDPGPIVPERLTRRRLPQTPIFIHASWRTSHTWFWLKFRGVPSTLCYYEPFHEKLAVVTRSEASVLGPDSWDSGHPSSEPYLIEYLPLIRKAGGVRLFSPQISYAWFLPAGGPGGISDRRKSNT